MNLQNGVGQRPFAKARCLGLMVALSGSWAWALVLSAEAQEIEVLESPGILAEDVSSGEAIAAESPTAQTETVSESESAAVDSPVILVKDIHRTESAAANPPATTVEEWQVQIAQSLVQIADVQVETTETGLQVVLETTNGTLTTPTPTVAGNVLTANIPNAVLSLPEGDTFQQANPSVGIDRVSVVALPGDQVQVKIVGTVVPPTAEVTASASGLTFAVTPGMAETVQEDAGIEITVTAEQPDSEYFVPTAPSTLKTGVDIRDTPSSIQVIPRQVIEDQSANNVRDIVRNASGVNFEFSGGNRNETFILRGFRAERFRNGFRDSGFASRTQTELANIEQVEVLKGPASILFGRAEPSGIINFVTKKPLREPFYELNFTAGSFDFYRPTVDLSGPITTDRSLAYRLNAAYESAGSFRDGVESERVFVAPTLSWQIGDNTELTLEYSYLHDTRSNDDGAVLLGEDEDGDLIFSPSNVFIGDPSLRPDYDEHRAELYLDHRFNNNLSSRSSIRYTDSREGAGNAPSAVSGPSEDGRNFPILETQGFQELETFTIQNDLIGTFNTGSVEHTVLFGLEYAKESRTDTRVEERDVGLFDVFNPEAFVAPPVAIVPFESARFFSSANESFGIYLQNQIAFSENLQLVVGGRFDTFNEESNRAGEVSETEADAFSPRVGIVYRPVEPVSLYASYTRSFTPNSGTNVDGETFDPERGTAFEVGVKTDIVKDRLFSTLAFYDTTLTNVITADPENDGFSIITGEQRSRGIELDIQGEILPGWKIFAGYAYIDAEVTEDNNIPVGNRFVGVPENNFNLWTTYTLQRGSLAGLGFGAGIFFVGERAGDRENSFFVDSYTRVDAGIYYKKDNLRAALNFTNVFDTEYIEAATDNLSIFFGAPFSVRGSISVTF